MIRPALLLIALASPALAQQPPGTYMDSHGGGSLPVALGMILVGSLGAFAGIRLSEHRTLIGFGLFGLSSLVAAVGLFGLSGG